MFEKLKVPSRTTRSERGFTLVELVVAVVILAILVSTVVGAYIGFRKRATDTTAKANVASIVPAIHSYFADHGTFSGMTPAALTSTYDQSINPASYAIPLANAETYCVQSTVGSDTWRKNGPAEPLENLPC